MLLNRENPFEYEGANSLSVDEIIKFYIEDYNYSRFILSPRNIFLIGERGTGKTMALLYNSIRVRYKKFKNEGKDVNFKFVGIHIPCKSPLFDKREYLLLQDEFKASVVSEHYLVLSIVSSIASTLAEIPEINESSAPLNEELISNFEYFLDAKLEHGLPFLSAVQRFTDKEVINTQKRINNLKADEYYENALSFSSLIIPFINNLKKIDILSDSHFMLMIDDAHDLNRYQVRSLNSWISYRDHINFSFKVASAKVNRPELVTSTGGNILEGHDFTEIEMEKDFYSKDSEFGKMARDILQKRLDSVHIKTDIENFFPINPELEKDLKESENIAREKAIKKFGSKDKKKINDFVYKYKFAEYYRARPPKSNVPPYSGLDIIIDISTGIIRNLLDPCYWMFDYELSKLAGPNKSVSVIPSHTQTQIILDRSNYMWERIMIRGLDKEIEDCTHEQSKSLFHLLDNLMTLLRERMLKHKSLPLAVEFYISQTEETIIEEIEPLLIIAQKAQILYTRIGSGKEGGQKEIYYIINRMLLPTRGLSPRGQYDRVGLKAIDIWRAAFRNKAFPTDSFDSDESQIEIEYES
jgi:hypothetical protein